MRRASKFTTECLNASCRRTWGSSGLPLLFIVDWIEKSLVSRAVDISDIQYSSDASVCVEPQIVRLQVFFSLVSAFHFHSSMGARVSCNQGFSLCNTKSKLTESVDVSVCILGRRSTWHSQ